MSTLVLLAAMIACLTLLVKLILRRARHQPTKKVSLMLGGILSGYLLLWISFFFSRREILLPFGTDVCFDDWCATVTGSERFDSLYVLDITTSNHARGIAQKPSEPRIHIIDGEGHSWENSLRAQKRFEKVEGRQPELGNRLELHESSGTKMVFEIPPKATHLMAYIEEGPFITLLLLPEDRKVFALSTSDRAAPVRQ